MSNDKGFHAADGWHFRRLHGAAEGFVAIEVDERPAEGSAPHRSRAYIVIDNGTWASIVASVSAKSETSASFQAAERLHAGEFDGPVRV
jgi:hypothetical protein